MFVDRPPQPVFDTADVHAHFIKVPPGTTSWFPVTEALGEEMAEVDAPRADGFTRHADAPLQQKFFDIAGAQGKSVVEPYGVADDREGEPVAGELLTAQHRVTLPQQLAITLPRNALGKLDRRALRYGAPAR
ncbi:hypothetical protein [Deinococcus hopiensis]|uniref:hypothetical protein n=1 Tax=Deinococcus hopiensis TaxID=309885 RepID=UPI003CCBFFD3